MATTLTIRSGDYLLINSTTNLTIGSTVAVIDNGVSYNCTVIKTHVGARNYVVKKPAAKT